MSKVPCCLLGKDVLSKSVLVSSCWYTSRTKVLVEVNHLVCPQNPSTSFEKIWKNKPDSNKIIHTNSRMFRQHHVPSKCMFDRPVFNSWLCRERWIQTHEALAVGFLFFCKKACTLLAATNASCSALMDFPIWLTCPVIIPYYPYSILWKNSIQSLWHQHWITIPLNVYTVNSCVPSSFVSRTHPQRQSQGPPRRQQVRTEEGASDWFLHVRTYR